MNTKENAIPILMKKFHKYLFLFTFLFLLFSSISLSQNNFNYGFQKNLDNYIFSLNLDYSFATSFGHLDLKQNYIGFANSYIKNYFRDDQNLNLKYKFPLKNFLNFISQSNFIYNADKRSITGKNQKINASAGFEYFTPQVLVSTSYGFEDNEHQFFRSYGTLINANFLINNLDFDEFSVNSDGTFEQATLKDNRRNGDLFVNLNIFKVYDNKNQFNIISSFKQTRRDFGSILQNNIIETRNEQKLLNQLNFDYSVSEFFQQKLNISWEKSDIFRYFNQKVSNNSITYVSRNFVVDNLGITLENYLQLQKINQVISINLNYRNEKNYLNNKFQLPRTDFLTLLNNEKQKDNIFSQFRVFSKTSINTKKQDTISFSFHAAINRYNTPDKYNYDDRDELYLNSGITYIYNINEYSKLKFLIDFSAVHLVFIRAQRSALNNWNRILRFIPTFHHKTEYFEFRPQFEVIANYTVYDFRKLPNSSRSYSLRQVAYNDSILFKPNAEFELETRVSIKYNERGILFWDSFSEQPQQANFEFFSSTILYTNLINDFSKFGLGARIYKLKQYSLNKKEQYGSQTNLSIQNIGPEINISIQFINNLNVSINAWYEFRENNYKKLNSIANFQLQTKLNF